MILIFRHVDCEGPGYLLDVLQTNKLDYKLVNVDQSDPVPADLSGITGMVLMGGGMSVNDDLAWIDDELSLIKQAYSRDIPVLGHCLGAQLMAKALGSTIRSNPVAEIGWFDVKCVESNISLSYPHDFSAFHWHGETFDLPNNSTLLYANEHCVHQGFAYDHSIALQFHIEMKQSMVEEWVRRFSTQISTPTDSVQSREEIVRDLDCRIETLHKAADKIYLHWLSKVNQ
ncbi:MAG: type 1 glutamine amidotransferase [Gammaproteobacteria bacterium]|nr:type 1 glutamine amidotransferase [Gammaproteobacteria bacterium]